MTDDKSRSDFEQFTEAMLGKISGSIGLTFEQVSGQLQATQDSHDAAAIAEVRERWRRFFESYGERAADGWIDPRKDPQP